MKKLEYLSDLVLLVVYGIAYGVWTISCVIWHCLKSPFVEKKNEKF